MRPSRQGIDSRHRRSRSCGPPSPASRSTATCTHSATRCWRCSTPRTSATPHKAAFLTVVHQRDADVADQIKQAREDLTVQQQDAQDAAAVDASRQTITARAEKLKRGGAAAPVRGQGAAATRRRASPNRPCSSRRTSSSRTRSEGAGHARGTARAGGVAGAALRSRRSATSTWSTQAGCTSPRRSRTTCQPFSMPPRPMACRSPDGAIATRARKIGARQAHCGGSQYAVYAMPSYQCHPPTAPPGASMHERGLAIDFTYGGTTIGSHSSPATSGCRLTPPSTGCTTCLPSPGTGRRTATRAR